MQQESRLPRSTGEYVRLSVAEHVALLELNDPSHFNALTMEMASDMQMAVQWLATQGRGSINSVVLQGAGDHFCPGGNMYRIRAPAATLPAGARTSIDLFDGFCRLRTLPMPVLCAVHGTVLGGGLAVCLLTDYVACDHAATFQVGERSRGIYPAGLLRRTLADAIGPDAALSLYLTDVQLTSTQAHESGLVQAVTPSAITPSSSCTILRIGMHHLPAANTARCRQGCWRCLASCLRQSDTSWQLTRLLRYRSPPACSSLTVALCQFTRLPVSQ